MPIETEIKLRLTGDPRAVLKRIRSMGYAPRGARQLEDDQLYDRAGGELRAAGQTLRVRMRGERATLTYKGPAERQPHKSREEIEVDVSDGASFAMVLAALGYYPNFRYQKYRTTFGRPGDSGIITLDETPMGEFLELEGPGDWIDETALVLGFTPAHYITESYAALYREFRKTNPAAPIDMTF